MYLFYVKSKKSCLCAKHRHDMGGRLKSSLTGRPALHSDGSTVWAGLYLAYLWDK